MIFKGWTLPHWLVVVGSVFGGAALSTIKTTLQTGAFPSTAADWQALAVAAVGAGVAAVVGLYVTPPGKTAIKMIPPAAALLLFVGAGALPSSGCAWWKANSSTVTKDVGQIGSCILTDLFTGTDDPAKIVTDCDGAVFADVEQIIVSLLSQNGSSVQLTPDGRARLQAVQAKTEAHLRAGDK